ncbi:chromosome condensation regulator, partial [Leptospira interrogans]
MKQKIAFILYTIWFISCSPQSRIDIAPLLLATLSQTTGSQNEISFQVLSPREGEILTVYQLETIVQANSDGEFEIFHEGNKLFSFQSTPSSPQTSPTFKPKNGHNTIQIRFKKSNGFVLSQEIHFYFGTKLSAGGAHSGFLINGELYTVGRNNFGQLGTGISTGDGINDRIVKVDPIRDIFSIHFNQNNSMAISQN